MLLSVHVTSVLFLIWFNNFALISGVQGFTSQCPSCNVTLPAVSKCQPYYLVFWEFEVSWLSKCTHEQAKNWIQYFASYVATAMTLFLPQNGLRSVQSQSI